MLILLPFGAYALGDIWPDPVELLAFIAKVLFLPPVLVVCVIMLVRLIVKPEIQSTSKSEDALVTAEPVLLKQHMLRAVAFSAPLHAATMYLASFFLDGVEIRQILKFYALFGLPTLGIMVLLWLNRRPKTSLGIGLSWVLVSVMLMNSTLDKGKAVADYVTRTKVAEEVPFEDKQAAVEPTITDTYAIDTAILAMPTDTSSHYTYTYVEQMPGFVGGTSALRQAIAELMHYPSQALSNQVRGPVYVNFVVKPDGSLSDVHVQTGQGFGCDEEAVRVVQSLPRFTPGQQNNRRVAVSMTIPIQFRPPAEAQ